MTYIVFFDYLKDNVWTYNATIKFDINSKGRHYQAEKRAERYIKGTIKPYDFRINKVVCD